MVHAHDGIVGSSFHEWPQFYLDRLADSLEKTDREVISPESPIELSLDVLQALAVCPWRLG